MLEDRSPGPAELREFVLKNTPTPPAPRPAARPLNALRSRRAPRRAAAPRSKSRENENGRLPAERRLGTAGLGGEKLPGPGTGDAAAPGKAAGPARSLPAARPLPAAGASVLPNRGGGAVPGRSPPPRPHRSRAGAPRPPSPSPPAPGRAAGAPLRARPPPPAGSSPPSPVKAERRLLPGCCPPRSHPAPAAASALPRRGGRQGSGRGVFKENVYLHVSASTKYYTWSVSTPNLLYYET